eukprot:CAMPEP_0114543206 /NCGR_PEP_ID=MMETSP0114-20121206/2233_1 /TAXON_ID=31324 /ORGANISM="Goniomonas sp, Strain m" /LENGTH=187 /DNA_ID=CAMNT_0001727531 /DNA_START=90 /DNA_END=649 /DNA_ORIENTATION=-
MNYEERAQTAIGQAHQMASGEPTDHIQGQPESQTLLRVGPIFFRAYTPGDPTWGPDEEAGQDTADARQAKAAENTTCFVCMENEWDAVLMPCGHSGLCVGCACLLRKGFTHDCPVCRDDFRQLLRIVSAGDDGTVETVVVPRGVTSAPSASWNRRSIRLPRAFLEPESRPRGSVGAPPSVTEAMDQP